MVGKARQPYKPEEKKRLDAALRANLRRRKLAPDPQPSPPAEGEKGDFPLPSEEVK